jgi:hypothetical protein
MSAATSDFTRHGQRSVRLVVEERVRPTEPAHPPTEQSRRAEREETECGRRGRVLREWPHRRALVEAAKRHAERLISRAAVTLIAHERMNDAHRWKARAGRVAYRGPATIRVPSEDLAGEVQTAHSVHTRYQFHPACWHLKDIGSTRIVEHVRPLQKARERLTVLAVANEAEAGGRRNVSRNPAHVPAPAPKREIVMTQGHEAHLLIGSISKT